MSDGILYIFMLFGSRRRRDSKHCPITFTGATAFMFRSEDAAEMY